jgi:putative aldouronate transport system permease protein
MVRRLTAFDLLIYFVITCLCSMVVIPFLYIMAVSVSLPYQSASGAFYIIPEQWTWEAYRYLLSASDFVRAIGNTVFITVAGTLCSLIFSITLAYALSKKVIPLRRTILLLIFFTLIFDSGLIPNYLLVKELGLLNSYWSLILPTVTNAFTLLIMKSFFQGLPESIEEAATIDGAGDFRILFHVVIPLSMPIIATFSLFFMVERWNEFFHAIIYISDPSLWPIQPLLRQMVMVGTSNLSAEAAFEQQSSQTLGANMKMAAILVAMAPIVIVYPFLQRFFAQGSMLGSVKE